MKTKLQHTFIFLTLLALITFNSKLSTALAQGTAFTYQCQLIDNGATANGSYDFTFALFNNNSTNISGQVGSTLTVLDVGVTNGLFNVVLDFGANFPGNPRWLALSVRTNGGATFTGLSPLQELTPTPYAIFASTASNLSGTLPSAQLSGTLGNGQLANNSVTVTAGTGLSGGGAVALGGSTTLANAGVLSVTGNSDITASTTGGAVTLSDTAASANTASTIVKRDATGSFSAGTVVATNFTGNGVGLTNLGSGAITSGQVVKSLNGLMDAVTISAGANITLTPSANNIQIAATGWGLSGNSNTTPGVNFLGTTDNQPLELWANAGRALRLEPGGLSTGSGTTGLTGAPNVIGGAPINFVQSGVVGATISGGGATNYTYHKSQYINSVTADFGTVVGGANNTAGGGPEATVGGGFQNNANSTYATVAGGAKNTANFQGTTVGGGYQNQATNNYATVPGGADNLAGGQFSFAAGNDAQATNDGSFVWSDYENLGTTFSSTTTNQFNVRANGGARFVTSGAGMTIDGFPVLTSIGSVNNNGNFFVGQNAGNLTTGGFLNTGIGDYALFSITSGQFNEANGYQALYLNTQGSGNTANGFSALYYNTNGNNNTATGSEAMQFNTSGSYNTATGAQALYENTTGYNNTASGYDALYTNTTGSNNTANGYNSLYSNQTGNYNTADGGQALFNNTTGEFNVAVGDDAMKLNTIGRYEVAVGYQALENGTNLNFSTAVGYQALRNALIDVNGLGDYNTAVGYQALNANTNGEDNTAVGTQALSYNTMGGNNTAVGEGACGYTVNGNNNTAIGIYALGTLGFYGAIDGSPGFTGGSNNIALGYFAGANFMGNESGNIDIGNQGTLGESKTIRIGTPGSQTLCYLAGTVYANGTFVSSSDRNAKENFKSVDPQAVLEKVAALPVTRWNYRKDDPSEHIGPMAQDFYAAFKVGPDDKHITTIDESGVALAAIQGLNQKLNEKDAEIQDLKKTLAKQKAINQRMEDRFSELEKVVSHLAHQSGTTLAANHEIKEAQ